jgi:hypothetical protein
MNSTFRILAAAGLLVLPFATAAPTQAQQVTMEQFLEVCPDIQANACPDAARSFLAARTPGAETDEHIRSLANRLEVRAEQPFVTLPICKDIAFGISILADGAERTRLERDVRDIAEHLCEEEDEEAVDSASNGDGDEQPEPNPGPLL